MKEIFISHRSTDKIIADKFIDLLATLGIPGESLFCSSLPGNDVKHKISAEIKQELQQSKLNIVILSKQYYESAYCLNEAGVIWFLDIPAIILSLDVKETEMLGFLNSEYKLRDISNIEDMLYVYEEIADLLKVNKISLQIINRKIENFVKETSNLIQTKHTIRSQENEDSVITDDEMLVKYYFAKNNIRKASVNEIENSFINSEIFDYNIDNAFDILNESGFGILKDKVFEVNIKEFRKLNNCLTNEKYIATLKKHYLPAKTTFIKMWDNNKFDEVDKLFISYLSENKVSSLGDRWVANAQIEQIKQWEINNSLNNKLSDNYSSCLNKFVINRLCYPCAYTSYGNPKEYKLYKTLFNYLSKIDENINTDLKNIKFANSEELPF